MEHEKIIVRGGGKSLSAKYTEPHLKTVDGIYIKEDSLQENRHWFSRIHPDGERWEGRIFFESGSFLL